MEITDEILEKYGLTRDEFDKGQKGLFSSVEPLVMKVFSSKEKKKVISLLMLLPLFETGKQYTESDINGILKPVYEDFVTLRRELINRDMLKRTPDGKTYWLNPEI